MRKGASSMYGVQAGIIFLIIPTKSGMPDEFI
jgi:hypothetical protein